MSSNAKNATENLNLSEFEKRLLSLSENNINCDCKFIVGSEKIIVKGHKILFSAASEVFQAMFFGELKDKGDAVRIPDLDPEGFQGMRFFIYTGKVNFTSALNALSTFTAARKYLIHGLSKECIKYIGDTLSPSEVLEFYENCNVRHVSDFEELCCQIIQEKTNIVVESDYFYLAKMETIEFLLRSPSLNLTEEVELIEFIKKWVKVEVDREKISLDNMTTYFNRLKRHIRFLTLSSEDFVLKHGDFSILTEKEKLAIAYNLLKPGSHPMPETLSSGHEYRKFTNFIESTSSRARRPAMQQHTCTITVPIDNCTKSFNDLYTVPPVIFQEVTFKITYHAFKSYICICILPFKINEDFCTVTESMIWLVKFRSKLRIVAENEDDDMFFVSEYDVEIDWGRKQQNIMVIAKIPEDKLKNECFLRDAEDKVSIEGFFTITAF